MKKIILIAIVIIVALVASYIIVIKTNIRLSINPESKTVNAVSLQVSEGESLQDDPTTIIENNTEQEPIPEPTPQPYVIAWISDTQSYYSYGDKEALYQMTEYIEQNYIDMNIQYMIHTGDIVDKYASKRQWVIADEAFSILKGKLPMFFVAGNHDVTANHHYDLFKKYYGENYYSTLDTFGGAHKQGVGRYDLIEINGEKVIVVAVGYNILSSDIEWINQVLEEHKDRTAILCAHEFIDVEGEYSNGDGIKLQKIIEQNSNIKMVLCGHKHGVNHFIVAYDDDGDGVNDREVYQLIVNYQDESDDGGGYFTFLSFDGTQKQMNVTTYSPYLDDYNYYDDDSGLEEFSIPWDH